MGPRSFNRGGDAEVGQVQLPRFRLNGAAVFQPRRAPAWSADIGSARCFNGAAVFQPRRAERREADGHRSGRFNGAAVFQPRRVRWRPRRSSSPASFNGAAVFQPRRGHGADPVRRAACRLQWGRGLSTAEGPPAGGRRGGARGASMGPRSFNRGGCSLRKSFRRGGQGSASREVRPPGAWCERFSEWGLASCQGSRTYACERFQGIQRNVTSRAGPRSFRRSRASWSGVRRAARGW